MKKKFAALLLLIASAGLTAQKQAIIIDHNCTKLEQVPESFIQEAKNEFRIAYQHTSHGSQLPSGMKLITNPVCTFGTSAGQLYFRDYGISGASDLGNPDRTKWAEATRNLLQNNSYNINMIMWSWCGQVSSATEADINTYLSLMSKLEEDFPNVTFVYMTGHLDGTGVNGNLNQRNEQIRNYCRNNGKVLFDFADIESYDPDGNYFLDKKANDNCDYYIGSTQKNWADEWCAKNPDKCGSCSCAHSKCINCQMKSYAFWWMTARLAGWEGIITDTKENGEDKEESRISIKPNPVNSDCVIEYKINIGGNSQVSIKICDLLGNCIDELSGVPSVAGYNKVSYNTVILPAGCYFIRLINGNDVITTEFIVTK